MMTGTRLTPGDECAFRRGFADPEIRAVKSFQWGFTRSGVWKEYGIENPAGSREGQSGSTQAATCPSRVLGDRNHGSCRLDRRPVGQQI